MTIQSKFADSLQTLRDAANGYIQLEEDYAYLIDHLVADNVLA